MMENKVVFGKLQELVSILDMLGTTLHGSGVVLILKDYREKLGHRIGLKILNKIFQQVKRKNLLDIHILKKILIKKEQNPLMENLDLLKDEINELNNNKLLLENTIDRRKAILLHLLLTLVGVLIGVIIALQHDNILLVGFQIISSLLLWFYSTRYKQSYLTGNILVAALTSICILMFYQEG